MSVNINNFIFSFILLVFTSLGSAQASPFYTVAKGPAHTGNHLLAYSNNGFRTTLHITDLNSSKKHLFSYPYSVSFHVMAHQLGYTDFKKGQSGITTKSHTPVQAIRYNNNKVVLVNRDTGKVHRSVSADDLKRYFKPSILKGGQRKKIGVKKKAVSFNSTVQTLAPNGKIGQERLPKKAL